MANDQTEIRKTAADFPPDVLRLFDRFVHGGISRRQFLDRAGKYAVAGATAAGYLAALIPNFAEAKQVAEDDVRIQTSYREIDLPNGNGKIKGYNKRACECYGVITAEYARLLPPTKLAH